MAAQKLNNRQKMINMMYLILTAMLALNVSSEALDAFVTFHDRLSVSATDANRANLETIDYIRGEVQDEIQNEGKKTNEGLLD
ncbi:MAG: gliding motility protein GldM, partial [Bacteroidota bacterium]